jgi:hypothetical protein
MAKVAVALTILVLVSACESHALATASPAAPSAPAGHVIPWTPLTPSLAPPAPSLGPAPLPPGTPPCKATDLVGSVVASNGATGHVMTTFYFTGVGPGSCYLDGTPSVGLVDTNGQNISFSQNAPYLPPLHPGPAIVQPGPLPESHTTLRPGQAALTIDWISQPESCPGTSGVLLTEALIALPSGGILSAAIPPEPAAYACAGLGVGAFEGPYVPVQPGPPPPLPAISMQVPSTARVGHALPYLVTLTNDRSQAFDLVANCPTYEEELFADLTNGSPPLGGKHIFALNCGPAGTLAPGASITFQMVFLQIPPNAARGSYTLVFMLGYWNAMSQYSKAPVTIA